MSPLTFRTPISDGHELILSMAYAHGHWSAELRRLTDHLVEPLGPVEIPLEDSPNVDHAKQLKIDAAEAKAKAHEIAREFLQREYPLEGIRLSEFLEW